MLHLCWTAVLSLLQAWPGTGQLTMRLLHALQSDYPPHLFYQQSLKTNDQTQIKTWTLLLEYIRGCARTLGAAVSCGCAASLPRGAQTHSYRQVLPCCSAPCHSTAVSLNIPLWFFLQPGLGRGEFRVSSHLTWLSRRIPLYQGKNKRKLCFRQEGFFLSLTFCFTTGTAR